MFSSEKRIFEWLIINVKTPKKHLESLCSVLGPTSLCLCPDVATDSRQWCEMPTCLNSVALVRGRGHREQKLVSRPVRWRWMSPSSAFGQVSHSLYRSKCSWGIYEKMPYPPPPKTIPILIYRIVTLVPLRTTLSFFSVIYFSRTIYFGVKVMIRNMNNDW